MTDPQPYTPVEHLEHRRAAVALDALCKDYGELETMTHMLATFPAAYGIPERLVRRLNEVTGCLHEIHDDGVK